MKRSIVVFMICLFVLCAASVAFAAESRTSGLFTYEIKGNGTAVITGYDWENHGNGDLYIPNMLDGYTVTGIGDKAFWNYSLDTLEEYIIDLYSSEKIMAKLPESIVTIGEMAFRRCALIKSINIPASVKSIGVGAFAGTDIVCDVDSQNDTYATIDDVLYNKKNRELIFIPTSREKLEVPEGIESVGGYAFYQVEQPDYGGLTIVFPNTLRHIENYAFSNSRLEDFSFPNSLETIGNSAFENTIFVKCNKLIFPSSVNMIGESAFKGLNNHGYNTTPIKEIDLQNTSITTIPVSAFESAQIHNILLPNTIKSIGDCAFKNAEWMEVVLQEGVESIGVSAFEGCDIREISLPSTLKSIGDLAFANVKYLAQVAIPDNVNAIGENIVDRTKVALVVTPGSYAETWATENGYMIAKQGGDDTSWLNYD